MQKNFPPNNKTIHKTKKQTLSYQENLAYFLLGISKSDKTIYEHILAQTSSIKTNNVLLMPHNNYSPIFRSEKELIKPRIDWLLKNYHDNNGPEFKKAVQILAAGVRDKTYESPSQIVVGVVGMAIPGPTLGKLFKKRIMDVFVTGSIAQKEKLASAVAQATHKALLSAVTLAGGEIKNIDPDMAEWFFGEKAIKIRYTDDKKINEIKKELNETNIPYGEIKYLDRTIALAASPAFNPEDII